MNRWHVFPTTAAPPPRAGQGYETNAVRVRGLIGAACPLPHRARSSLGRPDDPVGIVSELEEAFAFFVVSPGRTTVVGAGIGWPSPNSSLPELRGVPGVRVDAPCHSPALPSTARSRRLHRITT